MENMQEKMEQIAMEIILAAGDARLEANKALDAAESFDFATADQCLQEARKNMTERFIRMFRILDQKFSA